MAEPSLAVGPIRDLVAAALLIFGGVFLTFGTLGVLRMPGVYNKLHAQTKATTLGLGGILTAFAVVTFPAPAATQALAGIAFLLVTAPAAATALARAGLKTGKGEVVEHEEE